MDSHVWGISWFSVASFLTSKVKLWSQWRETCDNKHKEVMRREETQLKLIRKDQAREVNYIPNMQDTSYQNKTGDNQTRKHHWWRLVTQRWNSKEKIIHKSRGQYKPKENQEPQWSCIRFSFFALAFLKLVSLCCILCIELKRYYLWI